MNNFEINCDLGEGAGNEEEMMPFLDACSVACGGHTGDEGSMYSTVILAKKHGVRIGAHPSFPDREHFGRRTMDLNKEMLISSLTDQINQLQAICRQQQIPMDHVKPHGALYNAIIHDKILGRSVLEVMRNFPGVPLYAPWRSAIAVLANESGIPVIEEGFADRAYTNPPELAPRSRAGALLTEPVTVLRQVSDMSQKKLVKTIYGRYAPMQAVTFCVHGHNPAALSLVQALSKLKHDLTT